MKFYAQFNESNICIGVSMLSGEVDQPNMIEIPAMDEDYLNRKYEDGKWSEEKYISKIEGIIETSIEEQIYAENLYQTALLEMNNIMGGM